MHTVGEETSPTTSLSRGRDAVCSPTVPNGENCMTYRYIDYDTAKQLVTGRSSAS